MPPLAYLQSRNQYAPTKVGISIIGHFCATAKNYPVCLFLRLCSKSKQMVTELPFRSLPHLEDALSDPPPTVVQVLQRLSGDVLILGAGGKMGPSLARMIRRASDLAGTNRRVMGVARFSSPGLEKALREWGVETLRCDLLDEQAVSRLPEAANVIYLAGMKFGATGQAPLTWAMNAYIPALVCRRFAGSRIVAFSTGNVYGLAPVASGGSVETDAPAPVGEYAMSCLGRERIFEHFSRQCGTRAALIRLNYACDLRYGVLVDLALKIQCGDPVDVAMGWFNTIWQGDANALALQALDRTASPPAVFNVTGPETLNVRQTCDQLGRLLGKAPRFSGDESDSAILSNASRALAAFGKPRVTAEQLIHWVAAWVGQGGATLNKPTHFESRDGNF